jgi:hypothetical protein
MRARALYCFAELSGVLCQLCTTISIKIRWRGGMGATPCESVRLVAREYDESTEGSHG